MAQKRKANEAFGKANGKLSAFAAARLAREQKQIVVDEPVEQYDQLDSDPPATIKTQQIIESLDDTATTPVENGDSINVPLPRLQQLVRLSTSRLIDLNVARDDDQILEFALPTDRHAVIVGEYDVEVVSGTITIYGAVLHRGSSKHRVYALNTHAIPQITARKAGTVIRLSSVRFSLRKLERLSPLFRNISTIDSKGRSFAYLETASDDPLQRSPIPLGIGSDSQKVLSQLAGKAEVNRGRVTVMPIGPKSSGKSSFARLVCNTLLTRSPCKKCFYLDIDPGQPEFGPPGQVYLVEVTQPILGPSYTHFAAQDTSPFKLIASHTLAATTFKGDPEHYLACIFQLYREHYLPKTRLEGQAPLIINSCGWVTGVGARTICKIFDIGITDTILIDVIEPTLLQTARTRSENSYTIARPPLRPSTRTPAELRNMQTMAYFHHKAGRISRESSSDFTGKPIAQMRPWAVRYAAPNAGIHAITSYGQDVDLEFVAEVLDGSITAIVVMEDDESLSTALAPTHTQGQTTTPDTSSADSLVSHTPEGLPYIQGMHYTTLRPLDPRSSQCAALALVRGIDTERKELHLLTPLAERQVAQLAEKKVILVRGAFDQPEWAYLEDLYADKTVDAVDRPWVSRREMVGIEGAVWRLRHPPTASQLASLK